MGTRTARSGHPGAAEPSVRTRLLDAAEELFYERGVAATGVDAAAGGSAFFRSAHAATTDHCAACSCPDAGPTARFDAPSACVSATMCAGSHPDAIGPVPHGPDFVRLALQRLRHPAKAHVQLSREV